VCSLVGSASVAAQPAPIDVGYTLSPASPSHLLPRPLRASRRVLSPKQRNSQAQQKQIKSVWVGPHQHQRKLKHV